MPAATNFSTENLTKTQRCSTFYSIKKYKTDPIETIWLFQKAQILATISSIQTNLEKNNQYLHGEYPMRNYLIFLTEDSSSIPKCLIEPKVSVYFEITGNTILSTWWAEMRK